MFCTQESAGATRGSAIYPISLFKESSYVQVNMYTTTRFFAELVYLSETTARCSFSTPIVKVHVYAR